MRTTIPAAKDALMAVLAALPELSGVTVVRGVPEQLPAGPYIYVRGAANVDRRWRGNALQEAYDLRLIYEATLPRDTGTQDAVEDAMWAVVGAVDEQITRHGLSAQGFVTHPPTFQLDDEESGFVGGAWLARARMSVRLAAYVA